MPRAFMQQRENSIRLIYRRYAVDSAMLMVWLAGINVGRRHHHQHRPPLISSSSLRRQQCYDDDHNVALRVVTARGLLICAYFDTLRYLLLRYCC